MKLVFLSVLSLSFSLLFMRVQLLKKIGDQSKLCIEDGIANLSYSTKIWISELLLSSISIVLFKHVHGCLLINIRCLETMPINALCDINVDIIWNLEEMSVVDQHKCSFYSNDTPVKSQIRTILLFPLDFFQKLYV